MRRAGTQLSPEPMDCKGSCERLILSLLYVTKGTNFYCLIIIFFYRYFAYHILSFESSAKQKLRHFFPRQTSIERVALPTQLIHSSSPSIHKWKLCAPHVTHKVKQSKQ